MAGSRRHKASRKKIKMKLRGSKRYLHLLKFIATRREKKLEKRRTLDPSAKVTKPMLYPADDDDYDDDGDGVVEKVFKEVNEGGNYIDIDDSDGDGDGLVLSNHFRCFSPSMCLTSTEQTWTKLRSGGCQRRRTR